MAFREDTKVTPAERMSFEMVPETCPEIEAAFDKLQHQYPSRELMERELRSYGIEPSDRLCCAIQDICARSKAPVIAEARDTVLLKGTFPLRLALVQMIEKTLPIGQPESRYVRWLGRCKS